MVRPTEVDFYRTRQLAVFCQVRIKFCIIIAALDTEISQFTGIDYVLTRGSAHATRVRC